LPSAVEQKGERIQEGEEKGPGALLDPPLRRYERCGEDDDGENAQSRDHGRDPEALEDLGNFHPEVRTLNFLLRRTPSDVAREKVGKNDLGDVNRQATKENEAGA
jgi:hypothetical protein